MKKTILLVAITSLIYSCTNTPKEEAKKTTDSLSLSVDTLPTLDTVKCDSACVDTILK